MSTIASVATTPPVTVANGSLKASKVLVVEADYFALTSRIDPNVIFWGANDLRSHQEIPEKITHLWLAPTVTEGDRRNLTEQAKARGIHVWACLVGELRRRLLPFWAEDRNRSIADPVDPFGGHVRIPGVEAELDRLRARLPALHEARDRAIANQAIAKKVGIESRKKADPNNPRKRGRPSGKVVPIRETPTPTALEASVVTAPVHKTPPSPEVAAALSELPNLERKVFEMTYGTNNGDMPRPTKEVAGEFGIPEANVERILNRVLEKLLPHGFQSS